MIRVLFNSAVTAACILAYRTGGDPAVGMFAIGWCSAYTFSSIAKAIAKEVRS